MSLTFNKNQLPSAPVDVLNQSNNMNYGQREKKINEQKQNKKFSFDVHSISKVVKGPEVMRLPRSDGC